MSRKPSTASQAAVHATSWRAISAAKTTVVVPSAASSSARRRSRAATSDGRRAAPSTPANVIRATRAPAGASGVKRCRIGSSHVATAL